MNQSTMNQAGRVIETTDVAIIGAGPAGSIAGAMLANAGYRVKIIERQRFPRFSIGESLLPQCMEFLEQAGVLDAVHAAGFQLKTGAAFGRGNDYGEFDFSAKFSPGWGTTYQVQRDRFDLLLANEAARKGCDIAYEHTIVDARCSTEQSELLVQSPDGAVTALHCKFVLDASGFGRVLPKLFELDRPADVPPRQSVFAHVQDNIDPAQHGNYDREKILISVHPERPGVWYWLIPFSYGRSSVGVVSDVDYFDHAPDSVRSDATALLRWAVDQAPNLRTVLRDAVWDQAGRSVRGYASKVSTMHGPGFALLGNAGEFLDPVFSSGVTIATKSASMAATLLCRQLAGQSVDWQTEFETPLKRGVDTFRAYVDAWYRGDFQTVVFANHQQPEVKAMVCSILAGYAWDTENPFVAKPQRRLQTLVELCND